MRWRCTNVDDWGVATFNIGASNITLKNLTIKNNYGFEWKGEKTIDCPLDTLTKTKKIRKDGHQMALRVMRNGTKLKAINCHFIAYGGDTVSPWDVQNGLWYFKKCIMEGGVDFYCPRGWAWAEDCTFITHTGPAAIWHDGSADATSATILKNCHFKSKDSFYLGRYHRDAQFYLMHCTFGNTMRDSVIYLVKTNNIIQWGKRIYYYNCNRQQGNYAWFANNITKQEADKLTIAVFFKNKWNPLK